MGRGRFRCPLCGRCFLKWSSFHNHALRHLDILEARRIIEIHYFRDDTPYYVVCGHSSAFLSVRDLLFFIARERGR